MVFGHIFDAIEGISESCKRVLRSLYELEESAGDGHEKVAEGEKETEIVEHYGTLGRLFECNHGLLNAMGVGHASLDAVCRATKAHGLPAKLTGAGGGGCAIALISPGTPRDVVDAATADLQAQKCLVFETLLGVPGVRAERQLPASIAGKLTEKSA